MAENIILASNARADGRVAKEELGRTRAGVTTVAETGRRFFPQGL
jgi:hypothetical protein